MGPVGEARETEAKPTTGDDVLNGYTVLKGGHDWPGFTLRHPQNRVPDRKKQKWDTKKWDTKNGIPKNGTTKNGIPKNGIPRETP